MALGALDSIKKESADLSSSTHISLKSLLDITLVPRSKRDDPKMDDQGVDKRTSSRIRQACLNCR